MDNESYILKRWMTDNQINAPELARRMGIEKQAVYFQLKKEKLSDSFKHKLTSIGVSIFHLSTLLSTEKDVQSEITEPAKKYKVSINEPINTDKPMEKSLRQRIKDLEELLAAKDEIIELLKKQNATDGGLQRSKKVGA